MTDVDAWCMVFDDDGNAIDCFPYTAEGLEAAALRLREANGELTRVTMAASPFATLAEWDNPKDAA